MKRAARGLSRGVAGTTRRAAPGERRGRGRRRACAQPALRSSSSFAAEGGRTSAKSESAALRRRLATRMSCNSSGSSPSRVPGSRARRAVNWRRSTASATPPIGASASIAVEPNSSGTSSRPTVRSTRLVLRQLCRLKPAGGSELLDERLECRHRRLRHLDLDPVEPRRRTARPWPDGSLVEGDLTGRKTADLKRKRGGGCGPRTAGAEAACRPPRARYVARPGLRSGATRHGRPLQGARRLPAGCADRPDWCCWTPTLSRSPSAPALFALLARRTRTE